MKSSVYNSELKIAVWIMWALFLPSQFLCAVSNRFKNSAKHFAWTLHNDLNVKISLVDKCTCMCEVKPTLFVLSRNKLWVLNHFCRGRGHGLSPKDGGFDYPYIRDRKCGLLEFIGFCHKTIKLIYANHAMFAIEMFS